jgi:uncharacterized protein
LATIINKQKFFKAIKYFLYCYIFIGISLYFLQDFFLFHPTKLPANYSFNFNVDFKEETIIDKEGDTICLVIFTPKQQVKKGIIIYYHGNMNNITHYANFVKPFTKNGYEVWMQDYPGFGKSTGKLTEEKLYKQAMQVATIASNTISKDSIIIYGKSLGTGIAAYVASSVQAKKLILETPYYSIPSMFACYAFIYPTNILSKFKIPTHEYLQKVKFPITIFHGTKDGVIPYGNSKKLEQFLKPNDKFITIQGADHININGTMQYLNAIDSLLTN